jgi:hypothetical protein
MVLTNELRLSQRNIVSIDVEHGCWEDARRSTDQETVCQEMSGPSLTRALKSSIVGIETDFHLRYLPRQVGN